MKNEAENIHRLLDSVEGCFDEIHFTDTGSTDDSVAIAKSRGVQVHHFDWINDFSAARNFSFSHAKTDFVAWLDLDDTLDNPEAFKRFRDDVMGLADYWVAPYHYASDANGNPVCTFVRERVLRTSKQMRWNYAIHEGIKPESPTGPVQVEMAQGWAVRHRRTEADLLKDRSRNLTIFEDMLTKGPLDSRMLYYYGKELFEAGRHQQAIHTLGAAVTDMKLEPHDRILGFQYLCFAYAQTGNFVKVIELAHQGQILDPNRAEFYTLVGDAFLKMGRLSDAIPQFQAAKSCFLPASNQPTAVFHHGDTYTAYPRNQLARIYFHLGQTDRAKAEATECIAKYDHPEAKAILAEVERLVVPPSSFKNAAPCDDIVFTTMPQTAYEFDPGIVDQRSVGGSEIALIQMAYWLKKLSGRPVKVFNMRKQDGVWDGVEYISNEKLPEYMSKHKPTLSVNWRHTIKVTDAPTLVWSHDLLTQGAENVGVYDKILCLTEWHRKYMRATQGVPDDKIFVTRNGLDPDKFKGLEGVEKDPWKFVFSSSPDRGLDRALRVLDKVREKYPKIHLHVAYGIEHLPQWGHQALYDQLKQMLAERKDWVTYEGAMKQADLYRLFKQSAYCVQPSNWRETSMISAMERAVCGTYQIIRDIAGGADTLRPLAAKGMASLIDSDCVTEAEYQTYVDATCQAIEQEAYKRMDVPVEPYAWELVAREWIRDFLPGEAMSATA